MKKHSSVIKTALKETSTFFPAHFQEGMKTRKVTVLHLRKQGRAFTFTKSTTSLFLLFLMNLC